MDHGESGRRARRPKVREAAQEEARGRKKKARGPAYFLSGAPFPAWPFGQGVAGGSPSNGGPSTPPPPPQVNPGAGAPAAPVRETPRGRTVPGAEER